jgi:hypothetical protein
MKDHIMVSRQTQMTKLRLAQTAKVDIHFSTKSFVQTSNTVLYEAPFTNYHDSGLSCVMGDDLAKEVVTLVREVGKKARVA